VNVNYPLGRGPSGLHWIKIPSNFLPEFDRIRAGSCEWAFMRPTWLNKSWVAQLLIRSSESHKCLFTTTCLNCIKFKQKKFEGIVIRLHLVQYDLMGLHANKRACLTKEVRVRFDVSFSGHIPSMWGSNYCRLYLF
jgi:hypothetical protein